MIMMWNKQANYEMFLFWIKKNK